MGPARAGGPGQSPACTPSPAAFSMAGPYATRAIWFRRAKVDPGSFAIARISSAVHRVRAAVIDVEVLELAVVTTDVVDNDRG